MYIEETKIIQMALNPNNLQFLYGQLAQATHQTIQGISKQIFSYLALEVKDNPVYNFYESEREKWEGWPEEDRWTLPGDLSDAKSLAYDMFRTVASLTYQDVTHIAYNLFEEQRIADNFDRLNRTFIGYFGQALNDISNANPEQETEKPKSVEGTSIFIIHGHDEFLKTEILYLMKVAGVQAFVLHTIPDGGRTIIDKLIQESEPAGYAIALLSPDDITGDGFSRARQNVILEIGYFMGKIGKERIRMVVKGPVEIPSDLSGILYEKYDSDGRWKIKLIKEIQAVGIHVDLQAVMNLIVV